MNFKAPSFFTLGRWFCLILLPCLILTGCFSDKKKRPSDKAPKAVKVSKQDLAYFASRASAQVSIHYYGHGFVYITSSVGIRAAIDPFGPNTVHYPFPDRLAADFVLISHETEDHAANGLIFGDPPIYRSVTAEGENRANGIPFKGVHLQSGNDDGANTAFVFSFDEVVFGYLGAVTTPLNAREKALLGRIDVLFLPIGNSALKPKDLDQIATDLNARVIIPIDYKTEFSGDLDLRTLTEYTSTTKFPVREIASPEVFVGARTLPNSPTIYVLQTGP